MIRAFVLLVFLNNCVYGLNTFTFNDFRAGVPISKVTVKEVKPDNSLQVDITVGDMISIAIESQQKNNQWIALLSRKSMQSFKWSAAESDLKEHILSPNAAAGPGSDKGSSVSGKVQSSTRAAAVEPAADQQLTNKTSRSLSAPVQTVGKQPLSGPDEINSRLVNISVLQRNKICALSFELDRETPSTIRRVRDTVFLEIPQTKIALKNDKVTIPPGIPFSSIKIREYTVDKKQLLRLSILLDKKSGALQNGVVIKKGRVITFLSSSTSDEKLSRWSSDNGVAIEQPLYGLPRYNVDMKVFEKRVAMDAQKLSGTKENAFFMKETDTLSKPQQAGTASEMVTEPLSPAQSPEPKIDLTPRHIPPLIVTANGINLRASPSSTAEIVSKLTIGEQLEYIEKKGLWYSVRYKSIAGWVHEKNVIDSSKISAEKKREIEVAKSKLELVTNIPVLPVADETPDVRQIEKPSASHFTAMPEADVIDTTRNFKSVPGMSDTFAVEAMSMAVRYNRFGRDPFMPLIIDTTDDSENAKVENLRLVGVLIDNAEQIALLEDLKHNKKPFALRENDPVEHGKVLKIYKDKVVFLITEYGISRSYTIRLATKQDQEAGK